MSVSDVSTKNLANGAMVFVKSIYIKPNLRLLFHLVKYSSNRKAVLNVLVYYIYFIFRDMVSTNIAPPS